MATIRVHAPNEAHTGVTAGVRFHRGVAEVDERNVGALAYFQRRGYRITAKHDVARPPRNGKGSGRDEWAAYAATLGIDPSGLSKAELIERVDALES